MTWVMWQNVLSKNTFFFITLWKKYIKDVFALEKGKYQYGRKSKSSFKIYQQEEWRKGGVFYIDRRTYQILNDQSVDDETRQRYLLDEYYFNNKERKYNQKNTVCSLEDMYVKQDLYFNDEELFDCLTDEEKEILNKVYIEGLPQKTVAAFFCISPCSLSRKIKKIKSKLKKN